MPGSSLKIADTLSRAPEYNVYGAEIKDLECQVHMITSSRDPISEEKNKEFKTATDDDPVMQKLKETIVNGWPNDYKESPKELSDYWQHRDCLTTENGLIYKGEKMVVPKTMRNLVKQKIHEGHLGINKCTVRAKTYFFWPQMIKSIQELVQSCPTCQEHRNAQPKQPNLSRNVAAPWHTVGCDVFHFGIYHYLIITDYYSSFPEVLLINKGAAHGTSAVTIEKMKSIFARHGIPQVVISDGGPQFSSEMFSEFAKAWEFQHELSDPYFPRGNAMVERSVQTVKKLIRKAHASNTDAYGAILAYRTTPLEECGKSPAELLMNRVVRTRLNAHIPQPDSETQKKKYDPKYTNMHTRQLPTLNANDDVRIRNKNRWPLKAKVVGNHNQNDRSYIVETLDGQRYRRNRQHLLQTSEKWSSKPIINHLDDDENDVNQQVPIENDLVNNHEVQTDNVIDNQDIDIIQDLNLELNPSSINVNPVINIPHYMQNDFRRFSTRSTKGKIDRWSP